MKCRRLWRILPWVLLTPLLLLGVLQLAVSVIYTREWVVKKLETTRNCRAEVESVSVSLLSIPARVELRGLKLVPRDQYAIDATPLSERPPCQVDETMIDFDRVRLETNLWSLLGGLASVTFVDHDCRQIRGVRSVKGENSIRTMLQKPGYAFDAPKKAPATPAPPKPEVEAPPPVPDPPFNVSDLPFAASVDKIRLRIGSYVLRNEKKRTFTEVRDFDALITGLKVDPKNPSAGGGATVHAGARFVIDNQRINVRTLEFLMTLDGTLQLIDPATGTLNSSLDFAFVVKKGSVVNRIPTLAKLAQKLDKLNEQIGLDLQLPPEGTLTRDTVIKARLTGGAIRLPDTVEFAFDTYRIKLEPDSWVSVTDEQHVFNGRLMANADISKRAVAGVTEYLTKKSPKLAEIVKENVLSKIVTEKGTLVVPFVSDGEIGHPEVNFSKKFEDLLKASLADTVIDSLSNPDALKGLIETFRRPE